MACILQTPIPGNVGGQVASKAYLIGAALLLPGKIGWGQLQPFLRYQKFDRDLSNTANKATDVGVNYVINGSNAKVTAQYTRREDPQAGPGDIKTFLIGVQLQY